MISTLRKERQCVHVGSARVYPILAGLSKRGLVRVKEEAKGKRVRKLYSITPAGRRELSEVKRTHFGENLRSRFMREMLS